MSKLTHSEKAVATLTAMNTTAANWFYPPIEWKTETRTVRVEIVCPTCKGSGKMYATVVNPDAPHYEREYNVICSTYGTGEAYAKATGGNASLYHEATKWIKSQNAFEIRCDKCHLKPSYGKRNSWSTYAMQEKQVVVGYPVWIKGTAFDSRFAATDGISAHHCQLCAKGINQSNRVPVQGIGTDGKPHAMWIGEDCAKKILSISARLKADHYLADNFAA